MDTNRIKTEMLALEKLLNVKFKHLSYLSKAMYVQKINIDGEGENHKEYTNEGLATIGDAVLKLVIADFLYSQGITTKGSLTIQKSELENNDVMYKIVNELGIIDYAYNDEFFYKDAPPKHKSVANPEHTPYIEAIVGALYYDSNYKKAKNWIINWLIPLLYKYK